MVSRSNLAVALSKIEVFDSPDIRAEQHPTDSEVAADVLWQAYQKGDIENRTVADFGAGTGILGIGAILLGAKHVFFVENDKGAVSILRKNLGDFDNFTIEGDVLEFSEKVDTVIQNPPFGTRKIHTDRVFLDRAMKISENIYSFHKTATVEYLKKHTLKNGFDLVEQMDFSFPLKNTQPHHRRKIHRIQVSCIHLSSRKTFK